MSISLGASSNALSYLQQIFQQGTGGTTAAANAPDPLTTLMDAMSASDRSNDRNGAPEPPSIAFDFPSLSIGSGAMAALIAMQSQPMQGLTQQPADMFSTFDKNGDGSISKAEFETAMTISASPGEALRRLQSQFLTSMSAALSAFA